MTSRSDSLPVRDRLLELYEKSLPTLLPTIEQIRLYAAKDMLDACMDVASKAAVLCTQIILNCSDYPDIVHDNRLERRVVGIIMSHQVEIDIVPWEERINTAFECIYDILENYITGRKDVPFTEDVEQDLPITYVRRLKAQYEMRPAIFCNEERALPLRELPGSGGEYFDSCLKGRVTEVQRIHLPFISRQNIYKLMPGPRPSSQTPALPEG